MLQNGHVENLKKVRITRFPFIADISKLVPSTAGNEKFGASSPIFNLDIIAPDINTFCIIRIDVQN